MCRYRLSSIPENGSKGLTLRLPDRELKVIAVRRGGTVRCYYNICPHTGVNLDWQADQFLDESGTLIQCATHGALFRIEDGYCIAGPCAGESLRSLAVRITGDSFEILPGPHRRGRGA